MKLSLNESGLFKCFLANVSLFLLFTLDIRGFLRESSAVVLSLVKYISYNLRAYTFPSSSHNSGADFLGLALKVFKISRSSLCESFFGRLDRGLTFKFPFLKSEFIIVFTLQWGFPRIFPRQNDYRQFCKYKRINVKSSDAVRKLFLHLAVYFINILFLRKATAMKYVMYCRHGSTEKLWMQNYFSLYYF